MTKLILSLLIGLVLVGCGKAQPSEMPQPQMPSGYLYEVSTAIPGQKVYVCGERPFNSKGELVGQGNLTLQTRQVFENITAALKTVDMTLRNVTQVKYSVKGTSDKVDSSSAQALNSLSATYFTTPPKITEMKGVSQIVRDDILIEVEVIAVK